MTDTTERMRGEDVLVFLEQALERLPVDHITVSTLTETRLRCPHFREEDVVAVCLTKCWDQGEWARFSPLYFAEYDNEDGAERAFSLNREEAVVVLDAAAQLYYEDN